MIFLHFQLLKRGNVNARNYAVFDLVCRVYAVLLRRREMLRIAMQRLVSDQPNQVRVSPLYCRWMNNTASVAPA